MTRSGERQKVQHAFFVHCLLDGQPLHNAIPKFDAYVDEGKFDASADVKQHGREWLKKQALRIARGIYASTRSIGMPDPIAPDGAELHRIRKIAKFVTATHPKFSVRKVEEFLKKILAIFKGCLAAGLPLARIHSKIWQAAGGTHYKALRAACGIFDSCSGYKSMKLVMSRAHLGAKPCEARAMDWSTSFVFDRDLPAPSYEIARSIYVDPIPSSDDQIVVSVASFPSPAKVLPSVLSSPKEFTRLYVHHLRDPLEIKGSDDIAKISILAVDVPDPTMTKVDIDYSTIEQRLDDEIRGAKRRRAERRKARSLARSGSLSVAKVPEWQLLREWRAPGADHMELDEWLEATVSPVKEYNRELARAKRRRDNHNADRDNRKYGDFLTLNDCTTDRFHELRKIFGFVPWN